MHVGGGGRGWNNGPHNRYPNEQQHQQNQQYYNNSTHGGNNHNNNNFQGAPQENYMHQSQQQQHYQQNRYDLLTRLTEDLGCVETKQEPILIRITACLKQTSCVEPHRLVRPFARPLLVL